MSVSKTLTTQKYSSLNSIFEELNVYETTSKDLVAFLKQDSSELEKEFDWKKYHATWFGKTEFYLAVIFLPGLATLLFGIIGLFEASFLLFGSILFLALMLCGIISSKKFIKEYSREIKSFPQYDTNIYKDLLYVEIVPSQSIISVYLKRADSVVREKKFSFEQTEDLQETVIEWEEEVKQYSELLSEIETRKKYNIEEKQNIFEALSSSFDTEVTKIHQLKEEALITENQKDKQHFYKTEKEFRKIITFSHVMCAVGVLGLGTASILTIASSENPEVISLSSKITTFKDNFLQKNERIPTQKEMNKFIQSQNIPGIKTSFKLSTYSKDKEYSTPREGYYVKVSPSETSLPNFFSWEQEKTQVISVDYGN